jgi:transposase InsO family protein
MKGMSVLDQRLLFVRSIRVDRLSISAACRSFSISRPTGYELLRRFDEAGDVGLIERSRAPRTNPRSVSDWVTAQIVQYKGKHATWGPKKLRVNLQIMYPSVDWPAVSTFGRILDAAGLVQKVNRRPRPPRLGELTQATGSNDVWCMDFKGQFSLTDGPFCYPLTVTDNDSRYLLRCHGLPDTTGANTWPILVGAFREFGLPEVLRTDNGSPFASVSATGLSRIAVSLIKLGIVPERIDPGAPQQNGRHERMHRTLKAEATKPPGKTMASQQAMFDAWRSEYNEERPHEALNMATPASAYTSSPRQYPERMPDFEYPDAMTKRKVRMNGCIKWHNREIFISETLDEEVVGLALIDDGHYAVYAGFLPVTVIDLSIHKMLNGKEAAPFLKNLRTNTSIVGRPPGFTT